MTSYQAADLSEGWEFKILRSIRGEFKDSTRLQQILGEEGRAGWAFVEKFDDSRIRLKRPASARRNDVGLEFDPYRTYYGRTESQHNMVVLAWALGILAAGLLLVLSIALLAN